MSFAKLDELGRKLEALEHALAILGADEATHMAVGGGEKRAEAMLRWPACITPGDGAGDRRLDRGRRREALNEISRRPREFSRQTPT